jgi:protein-S-isoprenylcysteine O-methyltransferase Ste14
MHLASALRARTAPQARGFRLQAEGGEDWRAHVEGFGAQAKPAAPKREAAMLKWLARRRVPLGFLAGIAALWLADPTPRTLMIGAIVAVIGEAVRIWAAGHLEKGREVTMSGPYRVTRHPLYLGSTIIGIGLAIASASVVVALLVAIYLGVTLSAAIATEEAHLTAKFGDAYPEYREGRQPGVSRRFSAARALKNREYRAVFGIAVALALLAWKAF